MILKRLDNVDFGNKESKRKYIDLSNELRKIWFLKTVQTQEHQHLHFFISFNILMDISASKNQQT